MATYAIAWLTTSALAACKYAMASWQRVGVIVMVTAGALAGIVWSLFQLTSVRRLAVATLGEQYTAPASAPGARPTFEGADATRAQVHVAWVKVADGFEAPTDVQFVPGRNDVVVVAQKAGRAMWAKLNGAQRGTLFEVQVPTESELGLLGLAFHPRFADNAKLYVHYNVQEGARLLSRISEWQVSRDAQGGLTGALELRTILQVEQPYQNHNGGQLAFGPDGMLYIGLGDGGFRDDPHGHAQDRRSWLGKMLRIDVDNTSADKPYAVPRDNPFVGQRDVLPEIWAYGLRNPWRYSFDARGRLIVADVGQDRWEEIDIVERGDNLGWSEREGRVCLRGDACAHQGMKEPVYVYGRDEGQSITGGIVATASDIPALQGKYVFADFLRGRFWAIALPDDARGTVQSKDVIALGRMSILPSCFARDGAGRLYVADFGGGALYQLASATQKASL